MTTDTTNSFDVFAFVQNAASEAKKQIEESGQTAVTISTTRDIPADVLAEITKEIAQNIPDSILGIQDETKRIAARIQFGVIQTILELSAKGFFKDEIRQRLGMNSDSGKPVFSKYWADAKAIKQAEIAGEILTHIDRTLVIDSPIPGQSQQPVGERLFEELTEQLFRRNPDEVFTLFISEPVRGKANSVKQQIPVNKSFEPIGGIDKARELASRKLLAAFPMKTRTTGNKKATNVSEYVNTTLSDMFGG